MWPIKRIKVLEHERGLRFREAGFEAVLRPGVHWIFDPFGRIRVDVVSTRNAWISHDQMDVMVKSGLLGEEATVIDLADHERALVWFDGRLESVIGPGLRAVWNVFRKVAVEVIDARALRFSHPQLPRILERAPRDTFAVLNVEAGHTGLFFFDGAHRETLGPGTHVFWQGMGKLRLEQIDQREAVADIAGQELMTADKVTLRLNAVVVYRVADALRAALTTGSASQALYRDAQLALRAVVGARDLDTLLADREAVASELLAMLQTRAASYGIETISLGIRDVILPGEMKELMNRVTEARKAAEAALITRREETAAMRSQANTAKILESSPMLLRLRELEVLEQVAKTSQFTVIMGEGGGLTERLTKLL